MKIDLHGIELPVAFCRSVCDEECYPTRYNGVPPRRKLRFALAVNGRKVAEFCKEADLEVAETAIIGALHKGLSYAEFDTAGEAYPSYAKPTPTLWKPTARQKAILPLVDLIKSFERLPLMYKEPVEMLLMREDDLYMQREPLCKFGTYYTGIGDRWLWYSNNRIMQRATPSDCAKMLAEMAESYAKLIEDSFKEDTK